MPSFEVAQVREQGCNLLIVPLNETFEDHNPTVQRHVIDELQGRARTAGLQGIVVPMWEAGGTIKFIAPAPWHAFLKSKSWDWIALNVNRKISW